MTACESGAAWRPTADRSALRLRARMKARIRAFFEASDALEVDTPVLSTAAPTEPQVTPLETRVAGQRAFLQTSPEFAMKRLLAAGMGDCWQLARVFRDRERGRRHHPEFDLLEWYRLDHDHHELMDEVEAVVAASLAPERTVAAATRLSYTEAFQRHASVDPLAATTAELRAAAAAGEGAPAAGLADDDRDGWLDHLLTAVVTPAFASDRPTFVYDWPANQAALARTDASDARVASRFELFWGELELANGFHELADTAEQRGRFVAENEQRMAGGDAALPVDEHLLAALDAGLPDCAGVALGFDRLVMLAAGRGDIDDVLTFPFERA